MSHENNLQENLRFELSQIQKELKIIDRLIGEEKNLGEDEIKVRAAAGSLHSIYNGIEKIIQFVLNHKNINITHSGNWHSELLSTAKYHNIISERLENELHEYMGFRHFFRHSYGFMIDGELINPLLIKARSIIIDISGELKIDE